MTYISFPIRSILLIAVSLLPSLVTTGATAEYIQFTYYGEIIEVAGDPWEPWTHAQLGDAVQIQYIVDSDAKDQGPGSDDGRYDFLDFSFSIDNVALSTSDGYVGIEYGHGTSQDMYTIDFDFGPGLGGWIYFTGTEMLHSDDLPLDVDWTQYASANFGGIGPSASDYFLYTFTNYEYAVVPCAPSVLVLFFGFCGRRRRQ